MVQDLETIAASGLFYFSSVVADVVMEVDLAEMTAASGSSYFSSSAAAAAMAADSANSNSLGGMIPPILCSELNVFVVSLILFLM